VKTNDTEKKAKIIHTLSVSRPNELIWPLKNKRGHISFYYSIL